jgi:hypothetical protein
VVTTVLTSDDWGSGLPTAAEDFPRPTRPASRCARARQTQFATAALPSRPGARNHASSQTVLQPAYGLCRSTADRDWPMEIDGSADWALFRMSVSVPAAPEHADALARYHHHREASCANSLPVPDSTRLKHSARHSARRCRHDMLLVDRSAVCLRTPNFLARRAPHHHVRCEYGKSGNCARSSVQSAEDQRRVCPAETKRI